MNKNLHLKANAILFLHLVGLFVVSPNFLLQTKASSIVINNEVEQINDDKLVSLNLKNASLKTIFQELQKQTKANFVYKDEDIKDFGLKTLTLRKVGIKQVLTELFSKSSLSYSINGNTILISRKIQMLSTAIRSFDGKVIDSSKKPIVGATILVLDTGNGAISDEDGKFRIKAAIGNKVEISFLGMSTEVRTITGNEKDWIIQMNNDAMVVDDVVVTGIFTRKSESYTGSSVTVTAKELQQYGNRNILTSLRNIDPSFNIVENNASGSNPNKLPDVQVRGNSSLPNVDQLQDQARANMNTPLIIVDGFESSLRVLFDMNDDEVASITLLKDASATSIYGSRGANGVVVITTKAPSMGQLRFSYSFSLNLEMPDLTSYSLLNAKEKLDLERSVGKYNNSTPVMDIELKEYYNYLLNEVNSGVDTYWLSKPLEIGIGQRHNIRLDGGDRAFRYSASVQYNNTQGVMKQSFRKNINGNINLSYHYNHLKFTNNASIGINNTNESPYGSFTTYATMNPYFRTHDNNGNLLKKLGWYGFDGDSNRRFTSNSAALKNPLYDATLNRINKTQNTLFSNNFSVEWTVIDNLSLKGRLGISKGFGSGDVFDPAEHTMFDAYTSDEDIMRKGKYSKSNSNNFSYDASLNLSYSKVIAKKHSIYGGLDYNIRENNNDNYTVSAEGFTNSELNHIAMALQYEKNKTPRGSESTSRSIGATATLNYSYDNRYFSDISARLDGSSAFGSKKRFAPFWSAGLGWNAHKETFLKDVKNIETIKFRGSVGITGSQNFSPYQALSSFKYYTDDRYYMWMGNYLMGLGNDQLEWQQKMNYNLGLDTKFFKGRLSANIDVYYEKTDGLISTVDIPLSNGFSNYTENIGSMENKGIELKLSGVIIKTNTLFWSVTGSMMRNDNKVIEISEALKKAQKNAETNQGANPNTIYREGYPTNAIWVVPSAGIDPSSGKELFIDSFGNPTFEWSSLNLKYAGISEPKYRGNINTTFRYKKLSLTMSFGYRLGGQLYNSTLITKVENADYDQNVDSRVFTDRWKKPGDMTFFKGINVRESTKKTSRFVQDERTFTCQNINIQYELKSKVLKRRLGVETINFSANTADVFRLSSVKRERGTSYPFSRQISMSANVTF